MATYRVLMADTPISEEQLNGMAADGYRLVTIVQFNGMYYFYFEVGLV